MYIVGYVRNPKKYRNIFRTFEEEILKTIKNIPHNENNWTTFKQYDWFWLVQIWSQGEFYEIKNSHVYTRHYCSPPTRRLAFWLVACLQALLADLGI